MKSEVHPRLAPLATAFAKDRDVSYGGKGFGATALRVKGKIFAMIDSKGQFVVKLPPAQVEELVRRGEGEYFDAGKGRPMKSWVTFEGAPRSRVAIARQACEFVRRGK